MFLIFYRDLFFKQVKMIHCFDEYFSNIYFKNSFLITIQSPLNSFSKLSFGKINSTLVKIGVKNLIRDIFNIFSQNPSFL